MNETETRAELIDPALKAAGWGIVEGSRMIFEKNNNSSLANSIPSEPNQKLDGIYQNKNSSWKNWKRVF